MALAQGSGELIWWPYIPKWAGPGKANLLLLGLAFVSYLSLAIAYVFIKFLHA
jgi:hypothetical protein